MIHVSLNDLRRDQDVCPACNSKNYDMFATLNYASTLAKCQIPEEEIRKELLISPSTICIDIYACKSCGLKFLMRTSHGLVQSVESSYAYRRAVGANYFSIAQPVVDSLLASKISTANLGSTLNTAESRFRFAFDIITSSYTFWESQGSREEDVMNLLDLGSAYGSFSRLMQLLLPRKWKTWACELNPLAIHETRRRYPDMDILTLPIQDIQLSSYFDFIYCSDVIEHIWDLEDFLKAVRKIIRPDGLFLIFTPNGDCEEARTYRENWWGYIVPHHCQIFNQFSLETVLHLNGFEVISRGIQDQEFYVIAKILRNQSQNEGKVIF